MRLSALCPLAVLLCTTASASPPPNLAALVAETPAGGTLELSAGTSYRVSRAIVLDRPIRIIGHGARVTAVDGAQIPDAVIGSDGIDGVVIEGLAVDANVDRAGADYGIWIRGGRGHRIVDNQVANTAQACILMENASGLVSGNRLEGCGRALTIRKGGAANNHGIMIAALDRPVSGVTVRDNEIVRAYRKGITSYSRGAGSLSDITIEGNRIDRAGLGGVFVANGADSRSQTRLTVRGNTVRESYVGFEVDDAVSLTIAGNTAEKMVDRNGKPGAEGLLLHNVRNATVSGMRIRNSGTGGITIINSSGVRLLAPEIVDGNRGNGGYAPAIQLRNSRDIEVEGMTVREGRAGAGLTHGLVEFGPDGANRYTIGRMLGITRPTLRKSR